MKGLKRSVAADPAVDAALKRAIMDRAPDPGDATKFKDWLAGYDRVLKQVLAPEHLADLNKIARASEMLNRAPAPKGTVQLPKSMAGKFGEVTGNSLPGITAAATNVERGRSNPLYEFLRTGIKLADRQGQRATDAAWREALTNQDFARLMSSSLGMKGGPTPMQKGKIRAYLLTAGLLHPSNAPENP
jgi:hypothetical protein